MTKKEGLRHVFADLYQCSHVEEFGVGGNYRLVHASLILCNPCSRSLFAEFMRSQIEEGRKITIEKGHGE